MKAEGYILNYTFAILWSHLGERRNFMLDSVLNQVSALLCFGHTNGVFIVAMLHLKF